MKQSRMAFIIFGDFTFPEGNAATNRVHTYAKGFYENNISVHVICFSSQYNSDGNGIFNGISYYHPFGKRERNRNFIVRQWHKSLKYFATIRLIRKINQEERILAINTWTNIISTHMFIFILSKFMGFRIIQEHSEHPLRNYQGSFSGRIKGKTKCFIEAHLGNGIFCISQYLVNFYTSMGVSREKLFLVPGTVDTGRFQEKANSPFSFQYILYCGSLTIIKDGVHILVESFKKLSDTHPGLNLVLIGKGDSEEEEKKIRQLVDNLKINARVYFLGQLPRTEIPGYLLNAKILALARPRSIIADAGFPSKLTEYLATGIPVVVTGVGEIPDYLEDNINAFISEPDSVDAFADKLEYVLDNYTKAKEVGLEGKQLAGTVFNYNYQAKRMIGFIDSLYN